MKKNIYSIVLSFFAMTAIAQNPTGRLVPNESDPVGLIYNYTADNYTYYTSEYVPNLADAGTISTAEDNLKYTGKKTSSTFQQAMYRIEAGGTIDIDISFNPIVYVKMKGKVGDIIKVSLKNSAYTDLGTGDPVAARYFGGYNIEQTLTCSDYSWYKYDFTGIFAQEAPSYKDVVGTNIADTKNHINSFELTNDGDLTGRPTYDLYIDSVIMGSAGITPKLPSALVKTKWVSAFGAFTPPTLDYTYSNTVGNTCQKVSGENVFTYTAQTLKDNYETDYQIYGNSGKYTIDMRANPIIKATISGNVGDTLRFNLKQSNFTFIDGYDYLKVISATGYQNYTFDFTPQASKLTDIAEVSMNLYPAVAKTASSFKMSSLTLGGDVEYCSFPTGIVPEVYSTPSKTIIYPNPVSAGERIYFNSKAQSAEVFSIDNQSVAQLNVVEGSILLPSNLKTGLYMLLLKSNEGSSFSKIQVR
jgi:hypothetical protein